MKHVPITPPEVGVDAETFVKRARALAPVLRERARQCEDERRLPEETLRDFLDAGFYRICQPRYFGGYELGLDALSRAMVEIARGCASSAWVLCLTAAHNWWAAMYPDEGQAEMFGDDGDLRFPLVFAPQGEAVTADGGYFLQGRWNYASGCDVSNWLGVNAVVRGGPRDQERVVCVIRREEYEIHDNWNVLGLRGTGSKQAVIDEVFVPARRALSLEALEHEPPPGAAFHGNSFYSGPALPFLCSELASVAVGIGRGAVDAFDERARRKHSTFSPDVVVSSTVVAQKRLAHATALMDAAEALLHQETASYMEQVTDSARGPMPLAERYRMQLQMQQVLRLSVEAVDTLFVAGGTSAMARGEVLERAFRDVNAIRTHVLMDPDASGENWGRLHFGLDPLERMPGL